MFGIKLQDDEGQWLIPNEVLLHVFSFVEDRSNLLLTCKNFYSLVCDLEKNSCALKLNIDQLDQDETFNSIMNSEKQFNKFLLNTFKLTTLEQLWRLKSVCSKYGAALTNFSWECCKLTKPEIIVLLNFMPNLKSLSAVRWKLKEVLFEEPIHELCLPSLDRMKIIKCDNQTVDFFSNFLPSDSIEDLKLNEEFAGSYFFFLRNQSAIKKLDLALDYLDFRELEKMELSQLKLKMRRYKSDDGQSILQNVISNQLSLTHLNLISCEGCFDEDSQAFAAICRLTKLTNLRMNIDKLSPEAFIENFGKLKNLEVMELESVEHDYAPLVHIIDELSHLKMPRLKELKFFLTDIGVPLDRIECFGRNFKNLENYSSRCDRPLPLDCYLQNMQNLKSLRVDYHYTKEFSKLCNNFDFKALKLLSLSLQGFGFGSEEVNMNELTLLKLLEVVPNLETLDLDASFPFSTKFIVKILEKLPKLTIIRNWRMTQVGQEYHKFDEVSIFNLIKIAGKLKKFSLELRLKAIDMDASRVKGDLSKYFNIIQIFRMASFIVVRLEKGK